MSCSNADAVRLRAKQHPCVRYALKSYFNSNCIFTAGFNWAHGDRQVLMPGCLYVASDGEQGGVKD